jgi:predicted pyridoxine 5'-phosphate oxidase superfamily flavin-nucleotide-binding protein
MSKLYGETHRALQRRFDTERLADRIEERLVQEVIGPNEKAFIEGLDMFFLATADAQGRPSCSYKGGEPGFVRVLDERTLAFPSWDGNGMFLSLGNAAANPHVALLFIDFERQQRLRLTGDASLQPAGSVSPPWPGAQLVVRVVVREVFPNCPRYIHRLRLVERSVFVPKGASPPPVPGWKKAPWAADVLPAGDPAKEKPPRR